MGDMDVLVVVVVAVECFVIEKLSFQARSSHHPCASGQVDQQSGNDRLAKLGSGTSNRRRNTTMLQHPEHILAVEQELQLIMYGCLVSRIE
jgi:hypothetical protein